jgi:hypothetical protein
MMNTKHSHSLFQFLVAAIFLLVTLPARADYLCSTKERPLTEAQLETFARALLAMRAALSAPPEGWTMNEPSISTPPKSLCGDFKNSAIGFGVTVRYTVDAVLEDKRKHRDFMNEQTRERRALEKLPADKQAEYDRLNDAANVLRSEAREARRTSRGTPNHELAAAKDKEREAISLQMGKIKSAYTESISGQQTALYNKYRPMEALARNYHYEVTLRANDGVPGGVERAEQTFVGNNVKTNQTTDRVVKIAIRIERSNSGGVDAPVQAAHLAIVKGLIDRAKLDAVIKGSTLAADEANAFIAKQAELAAIRRKESNTRNGQFSDESNKLDRLEREANNAKQAAAQPAKGEAAPAAPASPNAASNAAPAVPAPATPAPAAKQANPTDTLNQAKDAANKLKGLFGR